MKLKDMKRKSELVTSLKVRKSKTCTSLKHLQNILKPLHEGCISFFKKNPTQGAILKKYEELFSYLSDIQHINMKLVCHVSEDGPEIELKYRASAKTSANSLRKYPGNLNLQNYN
jgi:hypothetical protein